MDAHSGTAPHGPDANPISHIRRATLEALSQIVNNARTRCVFEVATHKVEYAEET